MELSDYLQKKYLEHCVQIGGVVPESDWVNQVLNAELPKGEKLAYPSVNQWMKGGRNPDAKNIIRLIRVFGPEVIPYVGIELPKDLATLVRDWHLLPEEAIDEIMDIVKNKKPGLRETLQT